MLKFEDNKVYHLHHMRMKRMTLVGSALLALLFTTIGAGLVFAQHHAPPSKDTFKFEFPVTFGGQVVGTVTIDSKDETFSFAGKHLTADRRYFLEVTQLNGTLGSAETTKRGDLRIEGAWNPSYWEGLTETPTFVLTLSPPAPPAAGTGCRQTWMNGSYYTVFFWGHVSGTLWDYQTTARLPNKEIVITEELGSGISYYIHETARVYTDANGNYSYTRAFWIHTGELWASFRGDAVYCSHKFWVD
jgi:hypothetical protein